MDKWTPYEIQPPIYRYISDLITQQGNKFSIPPIAQQVLFNRLNWLDIKRLDASEIDNFALLVQKLRDSYTDQDTMTCFYQLFQLLVKPVMFPIDSLITWNTQLLLDFVDIGILDIHQADVCVIKMQSSTAGIKSTQAFSYIRLWHDLQSLYNIMEEIVFLQCTYPRTDPSLVTDAVEGFLSTTAYT